ncbi:MAG: haloacid dehalogenase type II [Actinophytocola sp.]|uniref:haloacid dehalogenase type II n=1 Tax=Actinophytocola sp. TaxID=1872138 RepID=UPI001324E521|nr:haloacid dehalogenase type II [Actinophytocola sp.]MPZ86448.1 haloacid dehalogenase type II [Actinophytocola sp.]
MHSTPALAFDVYGTLVDPIGISAQLARHLPGEVAGRVAEVWRRKQLEITFRLTAMGRYEDFEWCTRRALTYALAHAGHELPASIQDSLIARYDHLDPFPDAAPGLARLRTEGYLLAAFSNGTPAMLAAVLAATGLREHFDEVISVDEVRVFKPSPLTYHHAARRLDRAPSAVRLISSNPFDIIGAEAAGLRAAWIDRTGGAFEADGTPPDVVVTTLTDLADRLGRGAG